MLKLLRGSTKSSAVSSNQPATQPQASSKQEPAVEEEVPLPVPQEDALRTAEGASSPVEPTSEGPAGPEETPAVNAAQPFPSSPETTSGDTAAATSPPAPIPQKAGVKRVRRLSFRSFGFFYGRSTVNIATSTEEDTNTAAAEDSVEAVVIESTESAGGEHTPTVSPSQPDAKIKKSRKPSKAEKQAVSYALQLRNIIVGTRPTSRDPPLKKLKSELLKPSHANALIAQVRSLPTPDVSRGGVLHGTLRGLNGKLVEQDVPVVPSGQTPIHAVCLDCTDEDADKLHFCRLTASGAKPQTTVLSLTPEVAQTEPTRPSLSCPRPSIAQADLASVIPVLKDLKLIDLVAQSVEIVTDTVGSPADDFGFGQPPGAGVLSGAVPTADVIGEGWLQVGREFLNLGFATSTAVVPNHQGIYPPKDRLSALTYWWGYEVVIPKASMKFLQNCDSISHALLNFLTAFSLFNNGVKEILPFIRYASQFIDFEWNAVKAQDKGKGVVCAATWVMPAALVPRPWDFDDPPAGSAARLEAYLKSRSNTSPLLPGTEVIVNRNPDSPHLPMVTLSPPTLADAVVSTDDNPVEI